MSEIDRSAPQPDAVGALLERGVGRLADGRDDACTPSVAEARRMGEEGSDPIEGERLAFEAWMAGHCWSMDGTRWDGNCYRGEGETLGRVSLPAIGIRRMWAAWRDRAALARLKTPNVRAKPDTTARDQL